MLKKDILEYLTDAQLEYSVYIKDLKCGTIYTVNSDKMIPSASIIKLYIMAAAFKCAEENRISLADRVIVTREEKVPFSIVTLLDDKDALTVMDLITLMIIQSDNTATNKVIDIVGIDYINAFIKEQGFNSTRLQRKMMDTAAREAGRENYTSADDVAVLLEKLYFGKLVNEESSKAMKEIMLSQLDDSMMRRDLEDELMIAHKTGSLDGIKHDDGIVYSGAAEYIFVMHTWNCKNDSYAKNVIGNVSKKVYDHFN